MTSPGRIINELNGKPHGSDTNINRGPTQAEAFDQLSYASWILSKSQTALHGYYHIPLPTHIQRI